MEKNHVEAALKALETGRPQRVTWTDDSTLRGHVDFQIDFVPSRNHQSVYVTTSSTYEAPSTRIVSLIALREQAAKWALKVPNEHV